jgi:hypothetical protein
MRKFRIFVFFSLLTLTFVLSVSETDAQTVPARIRVYLDKNYPGWKFDRSPPRSSYCAAELRTTIVSGNFNADRKLDYAVKIVKGREGLILGFIARGTDYQAHVLEKVSATELKTVLLRVARKGEEYPVDDDLNTKRLSNDAPYTVPCESDSFAYYVYRNGKFN